MSLPKEGNKLSSILIWSGTALVLVAIVLLVVNFAPLVGSEVSYFVYTQGSEHYSTDNAVISEFHKDLGLTDNDVLYDFMLFIPKINARSRVLANVNPYDSTIYYKALESGIAHAEGTPLPGNFGNTFLFAHSGRNFYDGKHQNVQFYLLDKLTNGDLVYLKYLDKVYKYEITDTKKVWPGDLQYLTFQNFNYNKLTLMSCWPAGINYQRQLVEGKLITAIPFN